MKSVSISSSHSLSHSLIDLINKRLLWPYTKCFPCDIPIEFPLPICTISLLLHRAVKMQRIRQLVSKYTADQWLRYDLEPGIWWQGPKWAASLSEGLCVAQDTDHTVTRSGQDSVCVPAMVCVMFSILFPFPSSSNSSSSLCDPKPEVGFTQDPRSPVTHGLECSP